jgi:heme-degrading monooxygenase HmoA
MILETAIFRIPDGAQARFEVAFQQAQQLLMAADGYLGHQLHRTVERADQYLLLVRWRDVEAHTEGFRKSEAFGRWRALIGPFFAEPPVVEHHRLIVERSP